MNIGEIIINFILISLLGLLIAFNPSIIIVNLLLALKSEKPIRDTVILIIGVALPLIIIALICIFWLTPDSSFRIRNYLPNINIPPLLDILLGLSLMTYASLHYWRGRRQPATGSSIAKRAKSLTVSPGSIFSFAFIRSSLSITSILAVLVLSKIIVVNNVRPLTAILALCWGMAIGLAPLLAVPVMYKYSPESLKSAQGSVDKLLARGTGAILTIILALIGLGFLIHGAIELNGA